MESLLPISIILNFVVLAGFGVSFFLLMQRGSRVTELENMLKEAGGVAQSSKRRVESMSQEHENDRERLRKAELELADLKPELDRSKQDISAKEKTIVEMTAQLAELEAAKERARSAEDRKLALDKELAALRNELSTADKRVETAENAARDKQILFERTEASLEAKDKSLLAKQQECADQERELTERRAEIAELIAERDRLQSMEAFLEKKWKESEGALKESERACQRSNDELADCKIELGEVTEQLARLKQLADEQAAAGGEESERRRKLEQQLVELEGKLARKEAALVDLENAFSDAEREKPYEAHRHMEWTLNHFDPKAITFKFNNEGAKVFLVGVETNFPELRYELETGHDLPRGDFEARIKLAIKKAEQKRMGELPNEIDMTVLYALHVFPINFKIRPKGGQKIERVY